MNDIIYLNQNPFYNLKVCVTVIRRNMKTNKFLSQTVSTIESILLGEVSSDLKSTASLNIFKHKV